MSSNSSAFSWTALRLAADDLQASILFDDDSNDTTTSRCTTENLFHVLQSLYFKITIEPEARIVVPSRSENLIPAIAAIGGVKLTIVNVLTLSKDAKCATTEAVDPNYIDSEVLCDLSSTGNEQYRGPVLADSIKPSTNDMRGDDQGTVCSISANGLLYRCYSSDEGVHINAQEIISSSINMSLLRRRTTFRNYLNVQSEPDMITAVVPLHDVISNAAFESVGFIKSMQFYYLKLTPLLHMNLTIPPSLRLREGGAAPKQLYLLMGQSNMAGRGTLKDCRKPKLPQAPDANQSHSSVPSESSVSEQCDAFLHDNEAPERASEPYTKITAFDPLRGWTNEIGSSLHRNVDVLKSAGIGPGTSFAFQMLQLIESSSVFSSNKLDDSAPCIGLVPTAVGSTSLEEWSPGYLVRVPGPPPPPNDEGTADAMQTSGNDQRGGSCRSDPVHMRVINDDRYASNAPLNARYQEGCPNLLSSAMRSLFLALISASGATLGSSGNETKTRVEGILWYQGENEASLDCSAASTYGSSFASFLKDLRPMIATIEILALKFIEMAKIADATMAVLPTELRTPSSSISLAAASSPIQQPSISPGYAHTDRCIPVVAVAVTSTRPWLRQLNTVRQQQLRLPEQVERLAVVDAFGYSLKGDCIHLMADAAIDLGIKLAHTMYHLQKREEISADMNGEGRLSHTDTACLMTMDEQFQRARQMAVESFEQSLVSATERPKNAEERPSVFSVISNSGLRSINFTYGEVNFSEFCRLLMLAKDIFSFGAPDDTVNPQLSESFGCAMKFVDLGCGAGACLAAALLTSGCSGYPTFSRIVGIELMRSKAAECKIMLSQLQTIIDAAENKKPLTTCGSTEGDNIQVVEANFLEVDWSDADVVFACAKCFSEDLLAAMTQRMRRLRPGALVILVDSLVLSGKDKEGAPLNPTSFDEGTSTVEAPLAIDVIFELVASKQINCSWGEASAYFYRKVA